MTDRFCKTCRHSTKVPCRSDGRAVTGSQPADDYYWRCSWSQTITMPWPYASMKITRPFDMLGKSHVEGVPNEWTEAMDCPTWERSAN